MLIFGLDGATWTVLGPAIARGELPNLARLRARSTWGVLHSTIPPVTFPAWTTFATGVNPGKHGIFDFTRRVPGTYSVRFVNATYRKAPTVWRRLSDAGRRVCVLGIPGSYPPEPIHGCMISGFDTPVTTRADRSFIYPPEWADEILRVGGFPFADFQEFRIAGGWHRHAAEQLLRGIEIKTRLAVSLLRRERWDCFLLLFGESDTAAHHFWHLYDASSPRFDPRLRDEVGDVLTRVYVALDAAIGEILELAADDTVLIASDHGFGGVGTKALFLNQGLAGSGLQLRVPLATGAGLAGRIKRNALRYVPAAWQAKLFRVAGGRIADGLESRARFAGIDWSHTYAYSEDLNYFPNVWLNLVGREPEGVVAVGDYERVRDEVIAALAAWRDPESGEPVVRRAWRREEVYDGPYVGAAPDIILELSEVDGYSYTCLPSTLAVPGETMRRLDPAHATGKLDGMSGSHRGAGVYALVAPGVAPCGPVDASIADMGATILGQLGIDVPEDMDGRPIGSGGNAPGRREPYVAAAEEAYSDAQEREVEARLAALGYL